nr:hypothetical protein [uncultured Desulfuromonas sp.]
MNVLSADNYQESVVYAYPRNCQSGCIIGGSPAGLTAAVNLKMRSPEKRCWSSPSSTGTSKVLTLKNVYTIRKDSDYLEQLFSASGNKQPIQVQQLLSVSTIEAKVPPIHEDGQHPPP